MEKTVLLKDEYNESGYLTCICAPHPFGDGSAWVRPAVIVVPGGGYEAVSPREADIVAHQFLARGFQTFVLNYKVAGEGAKYPDQLTELACAVDHVKKHAMEYCVDPGLVYAVGFSAGGHLVADLAVEWKSIKDITGRALDCRPTAVGLCYPVITSKTVYTGTHDALLRGYPQKKREELLKKLDLENSVDKYTVPAFMWTTAADNLVPAQNSLLFALALARNNIRYELHVYPDGCHGGSTCDAEINRGDKTFLRARRWLDDCSAFFEGFSEKK